MPDCAIILSWRMSFSFVMVKMIGLIKKGSLGGRQAFISMMKAESR
jgi:hypothetical protein